MFKPVNPYSDENLKNWNPLTLIMRDILHKSIYWFLYMNDNFIAISDCKYVHITGFNQRQLLIST